MQTKQRMKAGLQHIVLQDVDSGVRKAAAEIIAVVAGIAAQYEGWPELLPWLNQCSRDPVEQHRAMAINLIANLIDSGGKAPDSVFETTWLANLLSILCCATLNSVP